MYVIWYVKDVNHGVWNCDCYVKVWGDDMSDLLHWKKVRVIDIVAAERHSLTGGPFGSNLVSNDYRPDGVPVIRGVNLSTESKFSFKNFVFVSEAKADQLLPNNAHSGDLIFTQKRDTWTSWDNSKRIWIWTLCYFTKSNEAYSWWD